MFFESYVTFALKHRKPSSTVVLILETYSGMKALVVDTAGVLVLIPLCDHGELVLIFLSRVDTYLYSIMCKALGIGQFGSLQLHSE